MRQVNFLLTALCSRGFGGCLSHQLCTHQVIHIQMFLPHSIKIVVSLRTLKQYVVDQRLMKQSTAAR